MEPGADLMLLHPDGREELLVAGGDGSITDPIVSFDGQWVYYAHLYNLQKASQWTPPRQGADIFKIHVKTRQIVRLTDQKFTPNTGAADWSNDYRTPREGQDALRLRRVQPGAVSAARRADRLHQQPRRLPPVEGLSGRRAATVRHGRLGRRPGHGTSRRSAT